MKATALFLTGILLLSLPNFLQAQAQFEEAVVNIGNVGLTVTNAGFVGKANVRNNPAGPPSFEYPLDSGIEHLFEAGLWIGAIRNDGTITVRTGAVTAAAGYRPGATGYEFTPFTPILKRSRLPESDAFSTTAISHQDYVASFVDTASVLPGTQIPTPDPQGKLGIAVRMRSYAWNFPFAEAFVILNFDIVNISNAPWDSIYVGMYHDLVVRNILTTTDRGSQFFNKGGYGFIDSLYASYAFNAGGTEETINTYGSVVFLGAEWPDPAIGQKRFFHPALAEEYRQAGYTPPYVNPRWWSFGSNPIPELARPANDQIRYQRMSIPYPNPEVFESEAEYQAALEAWRERLRTDGTRAQGNYIGLTPIGPFPTLMPGDTLTVTFAMVAALKPPEFQGQAGKSIDTPESRRLLVENIRWAQRTFAGEDLNYNGRLDEGEDINGNGRLDRYLLPEPPSAPKVHVAFDEEVDPITQRPLSVVRLYWDRSAERSRDPVSGKFDFEGYRIYRTNPGDDRAGDILEKAVLIAQYDKPGNTVGFNTGFDAIRLDAPVYFEGDTTAYWYMYEARGLLSGWQYLFTITAFDEGDPQTGLPSFESSRTANAIRIFPGTPPNPDFSRKVGVYPNPYRIQAAWDGTSSRSRRLNFYNLPPRCEVRIYTLTGEIVDTFVHEADTYRGDIRWFEQFSGENRMLPGGEHAWDILSHNGLTIAPGLYLFTVKDLDTGKVQVGKFAIIK